MKHSTNSYGRSAQGCIYFQKIVEIAVRSAIINYNSGILCHGYVFKSTGMSQ